MSFLTLPLFSHATNKQTTTKPVAVQGMKTCKAKMAWACLVEVGLANLLWLSVLQLATAYAASCEFAVDAGQSVY